MTNFEIIDKVWSVSRYYGNTLSEILQLSEESPQLATSMLLLIFENICRIKLDDYNISSINLYNKLFENGYINSSEHNFINNEINSLRIVRNKMAHRNAIKYSFVFKENGKEIIYPFTEKSTWRLFFKKYSNAILRIVYNLFCNDILGFLPIETIREISKCDIKLKELTVREIFELKGFSNNDIDKIISKTTSESEQYILAENASDIPILSLIFKNLLK